MCVSGAITCLRSLCGFDGRDFESLNGGGTERGVLACFLLFFFVLFCLMGGFRLSRCQRKQKNMAVCGGNHR